jgi:hypothetical protein
VLALHLITAACFAVPFFVSSGAAADEGASTTADVEAAAEWNANVHVNVLGPLQFGLAPVLEVGSSRVSVLARARWMNPGLLSQTLPQAEEELKFSYGGALGARYYFSPGLLGAHVGLWAELLRTRIEDTAEQEAYVSSVLVPQVEGGYRWAVGRLLLGVGATIGYAKSIGREVEDLSSGQDPVRNEVENVSRFYGSAAFDVGVFF